MIVDDIRKAAPILRTLPDTHVVRVPWQAAPWIRPHEPGTDVSIFEWTEQFPQKMIPRRSDGSIDSSWWRPPYSSILIAGEGAEPGCVFGWYRTKQWAEPIMVNFEDGLPARPVQPDWCVLLAQLALYKGSVVCICATQIYNVDGTIRELRINRPNAAARVMEFLRDVPMHTYNHLSDVFATEWFKNRPEGHTIDFEHMLASYVTAMALLSCKNITTERVAPPPRLQTRRQQKGDLPLVSYHILKVGGVGGPSRRTGSSASGGGAPLALHWVRGHFKTFTAEKPLLGRAVGTYWWGPHTAGKADRVVHKDYRLADSSNPKVKP